MRYFVCLLLAVLAFHLSTHAQQPPFWQANVNLPQLAYSACAWGDYDHDGDLDLALTGAEGNNPVTKIFRNDGGNFTDLQANLQALHFGSIEWGDNDNDSDLDLLVTGIESQGTPHTLIFTNTEGQFSDSGITLPGVMDGVATWGDMNNDGSLDILITGNSMARIYKNEGNGQYTNINAPLPDVETTACSWNDFNNDGQFDVLVCGNTGGGIVSKLFKNDHGAFTEVSITPEPFLGLYGGQAKWADLDNDGDQDLVLAGMDLYVDGYFLVYRNDGNNQFTKFENSTATLLNPSFDLGDYDGDGLTDIVLTGTISGCGGAAVTRLFRNLGAMNFTDVSTLLPGFKLGGVTWGDYNNDGQSDLLLTGLDAYDMPKTGLYLNNLGDTAFFAQNTPPSTPPGLIVTMETDRAILHWGSSSDAQTPKEAISYNICIGTLPGSFEVLSPLANLNSGFRTVTAPGNASSDTSWTIRGIAPGTYYFSVQAIDNGFMPGGFSEPCLFTFSPVGVEETKPSGTLTLSPNPFTDEIQIQGGNAYGALVRVYNSSGQLVHESRYDGPISTTGWQKGMYLVRMLKDEINATAKALKN